LIKRIFAAAAVLVAVGAFTAPAASAASACATVNGTVNGTALPVNGTYCLPEAP
jgi:hypothetical protein